MKKLFIYAMLLPLILVGCKSKDADVENTAELQGISLSKRTLNMEVGETVTLTVIYEPENAASNAPAVTWESSSPRIATVENGKVTGKQKGTATISAYCGKFYADCVVEVENQEYVIPEDQQKLTVSPTEITASNKGGTYSLVVTSNITWNATCEKDWATLSPITGRYTTTVTLTVAPNNSDEEDSQTITFKAGSKTQTVQVTRKAPDKSGKLNGIFSVSSSKAVRFSKGNLQYHPIKNAWQFADAQYEIIGEANKNISASYDGWLDLFGWGTGSNPLQRSKQTEDYPSFTDWGTNAISNGDNTANLWRTLSKEEWIYLVLTRNNAKQLFGIGKVNGIVGMILLPDDWDLPAGVTFNSVSSKGMITNQSVTGYIGNGDHSTDNSYTEAQWFVMESAGAVFLPAAGSRDGDKYYKITKLTVHYWTSSCFSDESTRGIDYGCYYWEDDDKTVTASADPMRYDGLAVRLVQEVK